MRFLFFYTLIISSLSFGQEPSGFYEIVSSGSQYSNTEIEQAFNNANLCGLILQNERNILVLNDGTKVSVLSANELSLSNISIQSNCVSDVMVKNVSWSISSGVLLRGVDGAISPDNKINIIK